MHVIMSLGLKTNLKDIERYRIFCAQSILPVQDLGGQLHMCANPENTQDIQTPSIKFPNGGFTIGETFRSGQRHKQRTNL